jgi:hypothetical protein
VPPVGQVQQDREPAAPFDHKSSISLPHNAFPLHHRGPPHHESSGTNSADPVMNGVVGPTSKQPDDPS